MAWMQAAVLALSCNAVAQAQSPIPKELEGWQNWVQDGQEFRHCPFLANTDGSSESNRICAWPGRLTLDLNQRGGRFTQTWENYSEGWVPLPGNLEYWPGAVTVNGVVAAVVARDGTPHIRASEGTFTIAGSFAWAKRPESQQANELSWFNDQAPGELPIPWALSLSMWWYKAAMLLWALWLAFALVRWLPIAWKALGLGGFWRKRQRSATPPPAVTG